MKRIVSAFLALLILLSLASAAGAEFFDEEDLPAERRTAIDYAAGKGVITGYPDRDFKPKETLTRAQAAKILCVALEGAEKANDVKAGESGFADVPASHWASGFVAYCAGKNIVAGVGEGKFNPDGSLSSAAFAKMLLVAYGHDPEKEGLVGADWIKNTDKTLKSSGFDKGFNEVNDAPLIRADACQLTYNFVRAAEEKDLAAQGYPFETFALSETQTYRTLGRTTLKDGGLICEMAASGVEFQLDCAGTLWATVSVPKSSIRFRAYVDGVMGDAIVFTKSLKTQPLFSNIAPGVHTIRILKDTQPEAINFRLTNFSVGAKKETVKPTAQKSFYMEVIGDSITSGYGFYGVRKKNVKMSHYSVGPSYGRKAADLLDADFSIISRGGIGLQSKAGPGKPTTSDVLYDYVNYYRDQETKYDFARKPDVVVVALGTNDKDTTTYHEQMTKFLAQIRERNNDPTLKIVIMHNMMTDRYETLFGQIAAEDPYCWELKVPRTPKGHPSMESEAEFAVMLADFIKTIR